MAQGSSADVDPPRELPVEMLPHFPSSGLLKAVLMKAFVFPLDQHFQELKPGLQVLKALEVKPTLPDWHLCPTVMRRTYRGNGLGLAAVSPDNKQDPQGTTSKAPSLSCQHIPTLERCFQRPPWHSLSRCDYMGTFKMEKKNMSRYCKAESGQDDRSSASECLKARC